MNDMFYNWNGFYQLTGGSVAGLLGLVFVAASLAARLIDINARHINIRTFVNPIIMHLSTVLLIAMLFMIPSQTRESLGFLLACCAAAGLIYEASSIVRMRRHQRQNSPINQVDWLWRAGFPAAGYVLMFGAALGLLVWFPVRIS